MFSPKKAVFLTITVLAISNTNVSAGHDTKIQSAEFGPGMKHLRTSRRPTQLGREKRHLVELSALLDERVRVEVCQCADRYGRGADECVDPGSRIDILDNIYRICIRTSMKDIHFEQVEDFGWIHGQTGEHQIAHGAIVSEHSFMLRRGVGTNQILLTGYLDAPSNPERLLWSQFKRSLRALIYRRIRFNGNLLARIDGENGEVEEVPFRIDIPVAIFRPLPFLRGEGPAAVLRRGISSGCVILLALASLLLVKDFIKLVTCAIRQLSLQHR